MYYHNKMYFLENGKYISLCFTYFVIKNDEYSISFNTSATTCKRRQKNSKEMNNYINHLRLSICDTLYLNNYVISNKNIEDMKLFADRNSCIKTLIYTYDRNYIDSMVIPIKYSDISICLDNMLFKNLETLRIENNYLHPCLDYFIEYANVINFYSKKIKYLHIDYVSKKTSDVIQECSELVSLNFNITISNNSNMMNLMKNIRCQDIIINNKFFNLIEIESFMICILHAIKKNKFIKKLIIMTNLNFYVDDFLNGYLLRKIEKTKLFVFQINETKIYPNEIFTRKDFFDVNLFFDNKK